MSHGEAQSQPNAPTDLFHVVVEQAPDAVLMVDGAGKIVFANEQAERLFGYPRAQLIGSAVEMLVPDSVRPRHRGIREAYQAAPVRRPMAAGKPLSARRHDGVEVPIELGLSPCNYDGRPHVLAFVRDVTAQRSSQDALRQSEERLREANERLVEREEHLSNLVKTIPDAVLTVDEDGLICEVNPAAVHMLGRSAQELAGSNIESLFAPEVASAIRVDRRRTEGLDFLKGAALSADVLRANGEDFRAAITVNGFKAAGARRYLWVIRDISHELRYEKERQSLVRALEEKNRELESIIYAASHDLRSPLVNLQGFGEELEKSCARLAVLVREDSSAAAREELTRIVAEEVPEALGFIRSSARRMDQLISGLLRLSRLGTVDLQLRRLDMNELLSEVARSMRYTIDQLGVKLEVHDLPPCHGDSAQLSQVFANLLDNAIKYRRPDVQCSISVRGTAKSRESLYFVEDNGPGIEPAHRARVFDMFHRLNPSGAVAGEGLGLAIVRRIVDRHNGSVRVESGEAGGCRFVVTLPAPRLESVRNGTQRVPHAGVQLPGAGRP